MPAWLIDTNVLLRSVQQESIHFESADRAIRILAASPDDIYISMQNVAEFWCVATRPSDVNGLGWSVEMAANEIEALSQRFLIIPGENIFDIWFHLVKTHDVRGKKVHDTRLVAVMKAHNIENLLTFNTDDFKLYKEINAVHPGGVI